MKRTEPRCPKSKLLSVPDESYAFAAGGFTVLKPLPLGLRKSFKLTVIQSVYTQWRFEWGLEKDAKNQRKQDGIDFDLATRIFDDPNVLIETDRVEDREERFVAIGRTNQLVLVVVHVYRETLNGEETIRILSARAADKREFRRYFQQAPH